MDRPTMQTVATAAGVSRMTVSNAYNRPDQLTAETRERILQLARDLGYPGPDPAAQSLRRRSTGAIAVVLTSRLTDAFTDPGLVMILHGIAGQLSDAGRALLLVPTSAAATFPVRHAIADAFILCDLAADDPAVTDALDRHIPVVTIGHPRLPGTPTVGIDNQRSAAMAASYLLELGHRRFGLLSWRPDEAGPAGPRPQPHPRPSIPLRSAGFAGALRRGGIEPASIVRRETANTVEAATAAMADVLAQPSGRRPTAVFAVTDVLALGVLAAAHSAGIAVPAELSVVGFDNIAAAASSSPPLTTVDHPLVQLGQDAARIALAQLDGQPVRPRRLRTELVIRASTGPAPSFTPE
ncbi:MAG TPA: LacI family DNA-binding transcriptional regulator [Streptosporangiaceae bacterium]